VFCIKCGFQLKSNSKFCSKCGAPQESQVTSQIEAASAQKNTDSLIALLSASVFIVALVGLGVRNGFFSSHQVAECHDKQVVEEVSVTSIGAYKRFVIDSLRERNANTFGMGRGQKDDWIVGMLIQQKFPLPTESQLNISVTNFGSVKTQSFQKEILKRQCSAAVEFNMGQFKDDAATYSIFMQMIGGASSEIPKRMLISYDIQYDKQLKQSVVDNVHFVR
jgi:hypothetical protein